MFKDKAVIGVMPLYDTERESYWMLPGYMKALEEQGAVTLMLPLTDNAEELEYFLETCDGFLMTGGPDVDPSLYGEEKSSHCKETVPLRDAMDKYILIQAVKRNKAVLGICRGMQMMNAVFGGSLYQDLGTEVPENIGHRMEAPYDRKAHCVKVLADTPLAAVLEAEECPVNSCHHQAVKKLAEPFDIMAQAADGIIESIYMPEKRFVWGVQWHPEFSYRKSGESRKILGAFLEAAKEDDAK